MSIFALINAYKQWSEKQYSMMKDSVVSFVRPSCFIVPMPDSVLPDLAMIVKLTNPPKRKQTIFYM
ncbi:MAG: hypothetical protein KAI50_11830 [Desulfobacterales bacterium]|nr:hypothetical protein [Desulfobacterales bacterium]